MKKLFIGCASLLLTVQGFTTTRLHEELYTDWAQSLTVSEMIYEKKTDHQDLKIFDNPDFGRVLFLDGILQLTAYDEFMYHEMLSHVPLFAHGNAKRVLIIGGGDGGLLREVLKHPEVEKATMVEIDASVVDMSKEYLPMLSQGAFDDPRVDLVIMDAFDFLQNCVEKYDVIIADTTDPIGPAEKLYTTDFYGFCKKCLAEDGIFVNQNGVPTLQVDEAVDSYVRRSEHFDEVTYYVVPVPTYIGGFMTLGWATNHSSYQNVSLEELNQRIEESKIVFKYYNGKIHQASFALPEYILRLLK